MLSMSLRRDHVLVTHSTNSLGMNSILDLTQKKDGAQTYLFTKSDWRDLRKRYVPQFTELDVTNRVERKVKNIEQVGAANRIPGM